CHGHWILSRSAPASHDDPGTADVLNAPWLFHSRGADAERAGGAILGSARRRRSALPEDRAAGPRSGAICGAAGLSHAVLPMAEFPAAVLGSRASNHFTGTPGLSLH